MAVAGDNSNLFAGSQADTLRLVLYVTLAVALMVTDHHSGYLARARAVIGTLVEPLYRIAQAPAQAARWLHAAGAERVALKRENDALRAELLLAQGRLNAARIESDQGRRLHALLDRGRRHSLTGRLVEVFDVDIDPYRQRVLLDAGSAQGIAVGQPVIDAHGLFGQVMAVTFGHATVMLVSDPDHAVPIRVARTGQRAIAYGQGRADRLLLPNLPMDSDLQAGDVLLTSGLGGRFPAGFPVAVVREVGLDANATFAQAQAEPLAQLRRSTELLLIEAAEAPVAATDDAVPTAEPSAGAGPSGRVGAADSTPPVSAAGETGAPAPLPADDGNAAGAAPEGVGDATARRDETESPR